MLNTLAEHRVVASSGTAASLAVARAVIEDGALLLIAATSYYETATRLNHEAPHHGWRLRSFDPRNLGSELIRLASARSSTPMVVWLDQPSNWWLESVHLPSLAAAIHGQGGILICDVSVHPLVPALDQGADVEVVSLSKYPSNGLSLGGLVQTNDERLYHLISDQSLHDASLISAEAAFEISLQLISLQDRFSSIAKKATELVRFAEQLPGVSAVRFADSVALGTEHGGGVLVLELSDTSYGSRAEEIIRQNFHREDFALTLACTFGGPVTTFEHFHPRGRAHAEVLDSLVFPLPDNFCRVGVGGESLQRIRDSLALAFPEWP